MPRAIALYLYEDFQLLDACGPITSFEIAGRMAGDAYRLILLSAKGGAIRSSSGMALETLAVDRAHTIDTLIVVGGNGSRDAMRDTANVAFLRQAAGAVRRLCSVCSGAFLLAGAGALDGRRATTHWRRAKLLARLFPKVMVEPDRIPQNCARSMALSPMSIIAALWTFATFACSRRMVAKVAIGRRRLKAPIPRHLSSS